jgi:SAM-dependent methyltransferase/DNA-binding transcriptional ArsR family regulator
MTGRDEAGAAAPGPGAADRLRLFSILSSPWVAQSCYALAKFGIPDLMAEGPRPVAELAAASGTDPRALYRILRALTAAGLVTEPAAGRFGLTPVTQPLRTGVPRSSRDAAVIFGEEVFRSFAEIGYTLRTGKPAFDKVYGTPFYDYLADNPDAAETFSTAMGGAGLPAVLASLDLDGLRTVVDVGGGNGGLLCRVLRTHPQTRGILLDLRPALVQARERVAKAGFADRVEFAEGSFFDTMPAGADAYVLCRVLHNWPDEDALRLLRRIRGAMAADGRLIVIEDFVAQAAGPDSDVPPSGQVMDLLILLMLSGCDRTEAEYRDLLARAGFAIRAVRPFPPGGRSTESAIEAVPV